MLLHTGALGCAFGAYFACILGLVVQIFLVTRVCDLLNLNFQDASNKTLRIHN